MSASLDSTLDPMEEIRFRKKHGNTWVEIQKDTHFTFDELEQIMVIFFKIQKRDDRCPGSDLITRNHFRDVLHNGLGMTDAYMMERVMVALDRGTSPHVTMATFAKAMSLYLRGDLEERITYAFTCYDLLSEGHLRRETMYQLMKKSLAKSSRDDDVEEAVKELVDIMLKRMDPDLDGVINFQDFHATVLKTPSLLESLGYCLPERPAVFAFIATWCPTWGKIKKYLKSLKWSAKVAVIAEIPLLALVPNMLVQYAYLMPMRLQTGGSVLAGKLALERGWAINVGGSFHHCSAEKGAGFCPYADITLLIRFLVIHHFIKNAMIVDLDAHQGNGYERDFLDVPEVYIMDMCNKHIYPKDREAKRAIRKKVELNHKVEDLEYMFKLRQSPTTRKNNLL